MPKGNSQDQKSYFVLSMLSNERTDAFARLVPLQTVVIDKASQIEVRDYLPLLARFRPTLYKLVFIRDDQQYKGPRLNPIGKRFAYPPLVAAHEKSNVGASSTEAGWYFENGLFF